MDLWPAPQPWRPILHRIRHAAILVAGLLSLVALVAQYGLEPGHWLAEEWGGPIFLAAAGVILLELLLSAWTSPRLRDFLRARAPALVLLALLLVPLAVLRFATADRDRWLSELDLPSLAHAYLVVFQVYVAGSLLLAAARVNRRLSGLRVAPAKMALGLFLLLITLGTLALRLPRATAVDLGWLDAVFTATSAVCVTGLIVVDTETAFTPTGWFVLGLLIQLGGLGIMAITGFLAVAAGQGLGIRERAVLADLLSPDVTVTVVRHLRVMVLVTLGIEAIGALLLVGPFARLFPDRDPWGLAVFHSISAFCNAGFSTLSENLLVAGRDPGVAGVVMLLVMCGGIGFATLAATVGWAWRRSRGHHVPPRLHVMLVWSTSAVLWVGGSVLFAGLEWGHSLEGLSWGDRGIAAVFHSVCARTAGFNSVDMGALSSAGALVVMGLMFVGGSPGSTAGGIKVTTLAVMAAVAHGIIRGRQEVQIRGREVHPENVREAIVVVFVGGAALITALLVLLVTETVPFVPLAFEAVSAMGTTGLSMGATSQLTPVGKGVLIVLMIVGRLGPLGLILAISHRPRLGVRYPTERVPLG